MKKNKSLSYQLACKNSLKYNSEEILEEQQLDIILSYICYEKNYDDIPIEKYPLATKFIRMNCDLEYELETMKLIAEYSFEHKDCLDYFCRIFDEWSEYFI